MRGTILVAGTEGPRQVDEYLLARQYAIQLNVLFDAVKTRSRGTKQHGRDASSPILLY